MHGVQRAFRDGPADQPRTIAVLRGVDLEVHVGEIVGLLGDGGAGKTTLLLCAGGALRVDAGAVRWFGVGDGGATGASPPPDVALVPDHVAYYPFLSVREALEYYATLRDVPLRSRAAAVVVALRRVGLDARAGRPVAELSAGARRRLAIAQALLVRPRLLLVDAPRDPIGEISEAHVASVLRELAAEGVALLVAARRVHEVGGLATRLLWLDQGVVAPWAPRVEARSTRAERRRARLATRVAEPSGVG